MHIGGLEGASTLASGALGAQASRTARSFMTLSRGLPEAFPRQEESPRPALRALRLRGWAQLKLSNLEAPEVKTELQGSGFGKVRPTVRNPRLPIPGFLPLELPQRLPLPREVKCAASLEVPAELSAAPSQPRRAPRPRDLSFFGRWFKAWDPVSSCPPLLRVGLRVFSGSYKSSKHP